MEQDIAAQVVGLGGATDFSLWKLFLRADFVVKFVIILLIACSIFSWALIFDKFKLFKNINKSIEDFEKKFWKAKSAESFNNNLPANSNDPAILIFKSAMAELLKTKRQQNSDKSDSFCLQDIDFKKIKLHHSQPMANIQSAKKRARQALTRNSLKSSQRAAVRTAIKGVEEAVSSKDSELAKTNFKSTQKLIDKMANKKVISKNSAGRQKSRLNKAIKLIS